MKETCRQKNKNNNFKAGMEEKTMKRVYNFSAGPAVLPEEVELVDEEAEEEGVDVLFSSLMPLR